MSSKKKKKESSPRQNDVWNFINSHKANIYFFLKTKKRAVNGEGRETAALTWGQRFHLSNLAKKPTFIVSMFIQFNIIKHLLHETTSPFVP